MPVTKVLSGYIEMAMAQAVYDKLEDGTYSGHIPPCPGVLAFAGSLRQCEQELQSTLEDWILLGLKMGHDLPILANINLNQEPVRESLETL
jgi:predicted RNase H-like HicB family nuclease